MNSKQYAVLGLGIFGSTVATTLAEYGCEVIAVDQDESCVERVADEVITPSPSSISTTFIRS